MVLEQSFILNFPQARGICVYVCVCACGCVSLGVARKYAAIFVYMLEMRGSNIIPNRWQKHTNIHGGKHPFGCLSECTSVCVCIYESLWSSWCVKISILAHTYAQQRGPDQVFHEVASIIRAIWLRTQRRGRMRRSACRRVYGAIFDLQACGKYPLKHTRTHTHTRTTNTQGRRETDRSHIYMQRVFKRDI